MFIACADEDIKDIEFTVTTLNCHQQQHSDDTSTPEHHRGISRLSMKKTGAIGKAVKSKLTKTLYNSMDGVKPKNSLKLLETHVSEDLDDKSPTSPSQPPCSTGQISASSSISSSCTTTSATDKNKKRSKLCALL